MHLGNITQIHGCVVPPVDVIVGGSPCQDLSIAGPRAGLAGERSGLYMEQIRIIKEMRYADKLRGRTNEYVRPRIMVWENVPGAFSSNKGKDLRVVLEETAKVSSPDTIIPEPPDGRWQTSGAILGEGWSIAWRVLDAQFWGVPQRRARIALVADFGGHAAPEILFIRSSVSRHPAEGGETWEGVAGSSEEGAGGTGAYRIGAFYSAGMLSPNPLAGIIPTEKSCTLDCNGGAPTSQQGGVCIVQASAFMGGQGAKARSINYIEELAPAIMAASSGSNMVPCVYENHGQAGRLTGPLEVSPTVSRLYGTGGNNTPLVMATGQSGAEILQDCSPTLNCNHEQPIVAHTLRAKANLSFREDSDTLVFNTVVTGVDCRNGMENGELCPTLQSKGGGGFSYNCIHPVRINRTVRRLTPLECERLQGYPDLWTDVPPETDPCPEEIAFWREVFRTWEVATKHGAVKGRSDAAIKKWLAAPATDSARYRALGNSIAIPPWAWVMKRIAACYERYATLGSLFDGIGGFPLIWERLNGPGSCLWASEIDPFTIRVTKYRFSRAERWTI